MELNRRETQRGIIFRTQKFVDDEMATSNMVMLRERMKILNQAFERFQVEHNVVIETLVQPEDMEAQNEMYESVQQKYLQLKTAIESRQDELVELVEQDIERDRERQNEEHDQEIRNNQFNGEDNERDSEANEQANANNDRSERMARNEASNRESASGGTDYQANGNLNINARMNNDELLLDRFKPPKFYGIYAKWSEWKSAYDSMVHNTTINDTKKFYLLKQCLAGQAERILNGWQMIGANYAAAYKTVCDIYENKYRIIMAHLDELQAMPKMGQESYENLRLTIDTTNSVLRQLRVCGSPVEHWDQFLVHHLITRMAPRVLANWETSHDLNEMPKLDVVLKFMEK